MHFDRALCSQQFQVTSSTLSMVTHLKKCQTILKTPLHQVLKEPAENSSHPAHFPSYCCGSFLREVQMRKVDFSTLFFYTRFLFSS